jgi:hypothetical protein
MLLDANTKATKLALCANHLYYQSMLQNVGESGLWSELQVVEEKPPRHYYFLVILFLSLFTSLGNIHKNMLSNVMKQPT